MCTSKITEYPFVLCYSSSKFCGILGITIFLGGEGGSKVTPHCKKKSVQCTLNMVFYVSPI